MAVAAFVATCYFGSDVIDAREYWWVLGIAAATAAWLTHKIFAGPLRILLQATGLAIRWAFILAGLGILLYLIGSIAQSQ